MKDKDEAYSISRAIVIRDGRNAYEVDAWRVINYFVKPVLAQHIADDGRLEAALEAIEQNFFTAFAQNLLFFVTEYPPEQPPKKRKVT